MFNKKVKNVSSRTEVAVGRRPLKMQRSGNRDKRELLRLRVEWSHSKQQNSSKNEEGPKRTRLLQSPKRSKVSSLRRAEDRSLWPFGPHSEWVLD